MNEFQPNIQDPERALMQAYADERERLAAFAVTDIPEGDYLHPVFGEGNAPCEVLLLGEAPGSEEAKSSRPFVGKAGKQLDKLLLMSGIDRTRVYVSNIVKYRPVLRSEHSIRNRTPGRTEILQALPLLSIELGHIKPVYLVTLGNTPLRAIQMLAGEAPDTIGALHGKSHTIRLDGRNVDLWPLYHPASGIYNRALVSAMEADAKRLGEQLVKAQQSAMFVDTTVIY
ncbi:MAG: uracil-DNA glycosylase [Clostridia bacterium]